MEKAVPLFRFREMISTCAVAYVEAADEAAARKIYEADPLEQTIEWSYDHNYDSAALLDIEDVS